MPFWGSGFRGVKVQGLLGFRVLRTFFRVFVRVQASGGLKPEYNHHAMLQLSGVHEHAVWS